LIIGSLNGIFDREPAFSLRKALITIHDHGVFLVSGAVALGSGVQIYISPNAHLTIGDGTYITADTRIICGQSITIGKHCAISWDVQIMDANWHTLHVDGALRPESLPIIIEDHVWIGSRASILKGVRIGHDAVIASDAVVTKDVPPCSLVAGNPARVLSTQVAWE
jgi:acetyltransferase-like isoleucine patch superfamily enzyme